MRRIERFFLAISYSSPFLVTYAQRAAYERIVRLAIAPPLIVSPVKEKHHHDSTMDRIEQMRAMELPLQISGTRQRIALQTCRVTRAHSWPNPTVSSTAHTSFCDNASKLLYGGKSNLLKHVCDLGNWFSSPDFSIVNLRGPSEPWRSLKPLTGIREVPVANCRSRDFCSASQALTTYNLR